MITDQLAMLFEGIQGQINVELVIVLMAIGAIIKHVKKLEKVNNNLIPVILFCLSVVFCVACLDTYTTDTIIHALASAFCNATAAVYCHQTGKGISSFLVQEGAPK